MGHVFLSYDRDDEAKARAVADALERAGHTVWWDRHIAGGAQYNREIERALAASDAVLVLWSERSVDSPWVRDEAAAGRDSGRLVPVTLDGAAPPLGFRQYQTIDLSKWKAGRRSAAPDALLQAISAVTAAAASEEPAPAARREPVRRPVSARSPVVAVAVLLALAGSFLAWQGWQARAATPVVAVAASDSSAGSRALARDLLIKLGSLQAARADVFRLVEVEPSGNGDSDLIVEASGASGGPQSEASLALLGGRDRSLLWSKQFQQPGGNEAHLRQQLAVTAGRVLNCALEALNDRQTDVQPDVLKLYLNGCASFDELAYGELRRMIPVMREVTRKAPKFAGAWGKLIQAEVLTMVAGAGDPALVPQLKNDIAQARRVNPHLAEAYLAEVELLSPHAYGQRLRLTALATRHNPNHAEPYGARAYYLRFVGRMADSVESAKRGAELNPLSPALQNDYITALSHAAEFERAKQELARAEQLWPGSSVVADSRFRFNLRYGDPKLALRDEQRGATLWAPRVTKAFLEARIDPTPALIERAVREARGLTRQEPSGVIILAQILGTFDRRDELMALLLQANISSEAQFPEVLFRPQMRGVRRDPRFMLVAKRLRLLDYWRQSGEWPDFCFEPDLPYDCKKEAARLAA